MITPVPKSWNCDGIDQSLELAPQRRSGSGAADQPRKIGTAQNKRAQDERHRHVRRQSEATIPIAIKSTPISQ